MSAGDADAERWYCKSLLNNTFCYFFTLAQAMQLKARCMGNQFAYLDIRRAVGHEKN